MREMIARLKATSVPYWRDEAGVILDDGASQPNVTVPPQEAQFLGEFDQRNATAYAAGGGTLCAKRLNALA